MRSTLSVLGCFADSGWPRSGLAAGLFAFILALAGSELLAQQPGNNPPGQNIQKAAIGPAGNQQNQNPLFAGPNNNLGQPNNGKGGAANADFDSLIDLIVSTVATDTWAENGGGQAEIRPFPTNLSLVISQTQAVHEEIADLLQQLRRLQDLQVTIEVRFIRLNDSFFERIGVDFNMNIRDNGVSAANQGQFQPANLVTRSVTTTQWDVPTRPDTGETAPPSQCWSSRSRAHR